MLYGYDTGIISGALLQITFLTSVAEHAILDRSKNGAG
jgi:hypothetical protein